MLQVIEHDTEFSTTIVKAFLHGGILSQWLRDYVLNGEIHAPAATWVEMFYSAALLWAKKTHRKLIGLSYFLANRFISVPNCLEAGSKALTVKCVVSDDSNVDLYCARNTTSDVHAIVVTDSESSVPNWSMLQDAYDSSKNRCSISLNISDLYSSYEAQGLSYGPTMRLLDETFTNIDKSITISKLSVPEKNFRSYYLFPPPLLDALLQNTGLIIQSVEKIWIRQEILAEKFWTSSWCYGHTSVRYRSGHETVLDSTLYTSSGEVVLRYEGARAVPVTLGTINASEKVAMELLSEWCEGSSVTTRHSSPSPIMIQQCLIIGKGSLCAALESKCEQS